MADHAWLDDEAVDAYLEDAESGWLDDEATDRYLSRGDDDAEEVARGACTVGDWDVDDDDVDDGW